MKTWLYLPESLLCPVTALCAAFLLFVSNSYGQAIYANKQVNAVTGVCLLCSISNPEYAVDSDLTNYSSFNAPVELLGASLSQTLIFPTTSGSGCDSLIIKVGSSYALNTDAFKNITVRTYNAYTPNNDSVSPAATQIRILPDNTQALLLFQPTRPFDRVKITYNAGVAALLGSFRVYYAYHTDGLPGPATIPASDTAICIGGSARLSPLRVPGTTYRWYDRATGGNLLTAAPNTYMLTVTPAVTTTYYVEAVLGTCISQRTPVKVTVHPKPANPVYNVPSETLCGDVSVRVENHRTDINYNVRIKYVAIKGTVYDTAYTVRNKDQFVVRDINYPTHVQAGITVQAVNAITGCKSDSVSASLMIGGHGELIETDADSVSICKGDSVTLHAFMPNNTVAIIKWYDAPVGGKLLFTGAYYKVSPAVTTTYYAIISFACDNADRLPVKVLVRKLPDPIYNVSQGFLCNPPRLTITNHQTGFNYRVKVAADYFSGKPFDTAYTVLNRNTIDIPPLVFYVPAQTRVYVQAVDPVSGCRSDSVRKTFTIGGHASYPSVGADSVKICKKESVTLHAFIPQETFTVFRWYTAPTGGTLLYTGDYYEVSPAVTTVYYVSAGFECEYPVRRPVKVIVNPCTPGGTATATDPATVTGNK
ncbi:immunoglobulin domain-containing protein [Chitinophaga nivalis]|uniref:Ig-like domain-containing protein n=1 Tax=Chitinophaga nivalis TaxID=2991709 RepID=A0ABT3IX52_9BACT|nr:hypothetical protein [Chitinophaga nivalis]MCW3462005.1 hypothetical protein [Chitinophaga nivalis]MCW3488304.1 hypothetical protein [Chitinophaga nivalis]